MSDRASAATESSAAPTRAASKMESWNSAVSHSAPNTVEVVTVIPQGPAGSLATRTQASLGSVNGQWPDRGTLPTLECSSRRRGREGTFHPLTLPDRIAARVVSVPAIRLATGRAIELAAVISS